MKHSSLFAAYVKNSSIKRGIEIIQAVKSAAEVRVYDSHEVRPVKVAFARPKREFPQQVLDEENAVFVRHDFTAKQPAQ